MNLGLFQKIFKKYSKYGAYTFLSTLFSDISNYFIDVGISRQQGCKYSIFSCLIINTVVSWDVTLARIFQWLNPYCRTMTLGSTQPQTEVSKK
jgi:hypothetical protein